MNKFGIMCVRSNQSAFGPRAGWMINDNGTHRLFDCHEDAYTEAARVQADMDNPNLIYFAKEYSL